jgi:hypothetical protein
VQGTVSTGSQTSLYWFPDSGLHLQLGAHLTHGMTQTALQFRLYDCELSQAEIQSVVAEPWRIIQQPGARRYVFLGAGAFQFAYPISDLIAGGWTPSTGGSLYATIDEPTTPVDTDYDLSAGTPTNDLMKVQLTALQVPQAGDVIVSIRGRHE